ncbi:MAG: response regulator [Desulfobacterales bacterium]|jgi:PAS domain S-box-containing protein
MRDNDGWRIVLIDDEEGIRRVTGITLEDAGYSVYTADNGQSGLALCEEVSPQIVITDVRMPKMDGIQVLEAIKQAHPETEVIVATAFGEMDLAIRALQLDASDFITKPLHSEALGVALERAKTRYNDRKQLKDYTIFLEEGWNDTTRELMAAFTFQNSLIESSMDGIIGCGADEVVIIFNRSAKEMLGYRKENVLHKMKLGRFLLPEEESRLKRALAASDQGEGGRLALFETTLCGNNGQRIPTQMSVAKVAIPDEAPGTVCFLRDLREIRRLEREVEDQAVILHQDKMMSLGRLAASVVHEINNPLAGILNYCRLMIRILQKGAASADQMGKFARYLDLVEKETSRCSQIVSSLLTFSRKSPAEFGPVVVNDLMERCILLCQHKLKLSNIRLETHVEGHLPEIKGDFNQLQQCVINLVFNAVDAMPEGGSLTLSAARCPSAAEVCVQVADTGTGVAEKDLPHIFEPFFTTKDEGYGVGLGLSTVYGIIQNHEGHVKVESQPGQGTTFTLRLPVL